MKAHLFLSILMAITSTLFAQIKKVEGPSVNFNNGKLMISENKRFLQHENGTCFFYLGDTAWELFHRLNYKQADKYLENRREKGFTVIQAVILAELDGLNTPNMNGDKPLIDNDPSKPNEDYFLFVDSLIRLAEMKGMYIGLLPTWGDKVDKRWGVGPVIFTPENASIYGKYLGQRYKDFPNIIWINGGDRSGGDGNTEIWDALGKGIKTIDKNHIMTFHPWGGFSSSQWFHNSE